MENTIITNVSGSNNTIITNVSDSKITVGNNRHIGDDYIQTEQMSVNDLLGQNKVEEALKLLASKGKDVTFLQSRYSRLVREENLGVISISDARIERNRIVVAIQSIAGTASRIEAQNVNYWIIGGVNCQDPDAFQKFISKKRHGVAAEYDEAIQFGNAVLSYIKDKFDERDFNAEFLPLRYAIEDLQSRQTLDRMEAVISQVQKHQDLILRFLKKEVKESPLEKMYNDANEANGLSFLEKYDTFLKKYLEINSTTDQKVYEKWLYDREVFIEEAGSNEKELYFKSQLKRLRTKWLPKFRPFS